MNAIRQATAFDFAKLMTLGAIWGAAFLCIKLGLEGFAPITLAVSRTLLGVVVLLILLAATGTKLPHRRRDWGWIAVIGAVNTSLPFLLIAWGQQFIGAGLASILMGAGPFVALFANHVLTHDDRITGYKVAGMILGLLGVMILVGGEALTGLTASFFGQLAIVGAAASYAASGVMTRKISHLPAASGASATLLMGAVYLLPAAFIFEAPLASRPGIAAIAAVLFLGLVSSGFAHLLRFQLIRDTGAVFMSQVSYLVPLFGVFWAWVFLGERLHVEAWIALALILSGIGISRLRRKRKARLLDEL